MIVYVLLWENSLIINDNLIFDCIKNNNKKMDRETNILF